MNITFNPYPFFMSIILPGLILTGIIMLWIEFRGSRNKGLRILTSAVAITSAMIFALQPMIEREVDPGIFVLLTRNYDESILDSLKTAYRDLEIVNTEKDEFVLSRFVSENSIEELFVIGDGLKPYDLEQLKEIPSVYLPGSEPLGIVGINYNQKVIKGKSMDLEVSTRMIREGYLVMNTPGGEIDTFQIQNGLRSLKVNSLKTVIGNYVDHISLFDSEHTLIDRGLIPYTVKRPDPVKVLFLMGFPDFESKFLKNWLGENNHEVVIRSRVSKDKFLIESINAERAIDNITSLDYLQDVDLIISDVDGWKGLSTIQRELIQRFVRQNGLGLLFLITSAGDVNDARIREILMPNSFVKDQHGKADFTLLESGVKFTLPRIELSHGSNAFSFPITFDSKDTETSFASFSGLGKIGFSLVSNTYSLILNGFRETYSAYWSDILEVMSKSWNRKFAEVHTSGLGRRFAPLNLQINTESKNPDLKIDSVTTGLRQSPYFDKVWFAKFWPERDGWISIQVDDHLADYIFVYPEEYCTNVERESLRNANTVALSNRSVNSPVVHDSYKPISWIYFFLIFVLSMGYLWLEPRL